MNDNALENRFTYHPVRSEDQAKTYERIRAAGKEFARIVNELAPERPEKGTAIDKIDEAVMWANAAISRGTHG